MQLKVNILAPACGAESPARLGDLSKQAYNFSKSVCLFDIGVLAAMTVFLSRFGSKVLFWKKGWVAFSAGLGLLLGLIVAQAAMAEPRVALVVGNSDYQGDMPALPNPANDAKLMVKTLKGIGFDVVGVENATQAELKKAILEFGNRLTAAGRDATGLFFYAGHGVQVNGENYLIPTDAQIGKEADVDLAAVTLSSIMSQMQFADNAVNIVILDACRDNPLKGSARGLTRGLAEVKTPTSGTFIAYSTAPGETAADGDGINSPYTKALAQTLTEPGLSIGDVFQEVRSKVLADTGQQQRPWDASSLTGRFYFKPPDATQTASATPAPSVVPAAPAAAPSSVGDLDMEKAYWDTVKDSDDPDDIQLYLTKYPQGYFVDLANAKIEALKGTKVASATTNGDATARSSEPSAGAAQTVQPPNAEQASIIAMADTTIYAKTKGAQVRAAPSKQAEVLSKAATNEELIATGETKDGKWWRVKVGDGQGYISKSVTSGQPIQVSAAAPAQAPAAQPAGQTATLGADAFETTGAAAASAPAQNTDVASQIFQGFAQSAAQSAAQQLGLPGVNIRQPPAQQAAAEIACCNPMNKQIQVRPGAEIFDAPGGRAILTAKQGGALTASGRSSDGRWYQVRLWNGQQAYVAMQSVQQ